METLRDDCEFKFPYFSSYPTYEEWKLLLKSNILHLQICGSYPTYEEWKLCFGCSIAFPSSVLILPMRNGNTRKNRFYGILQRVLILPMRNGNGEDAFLIDQYSEQVLILPMRNGNLSKLERIPEIVPSVLILPMRNGNQ